MKEGILLAKNSTAWTKEEKETINADILIISRNDAKNITQPVAKGFGKRFWFSAVHQKMITKTKETIIMFIGKYLILS